MSEGGIDRRIDRHKAVEQLHERYAVQVYHKCKRMLGDATEAEDAVQETFLRAYKAFDSFAQRTLEEQSYWLYRTASYVCLHLLRTRRRRRLVNAPRWVESTAAAGPGQEQQIGARMELGRLVDRLDQKDETILLAHHVGGMSQGEVATAMGVSRRAVVKRLTSLRRTLAPPLRNVTVCG